jgi:hypothetical protein
VGPLSGLVASNAGCQSPQPNHTPKKPPHKGGFLRSGPRARSPRDNRPARPRPPRAGMDGDAVDHVPHDLQSFVARQCLVEVDDPLTVERGHDGRAAASLRSPTSTALQPPHSVKLVLQAGPAPTRVASVRTQYQTPFLLRADPALPLERSSAWVTSVGEIQARERGSRSAKRSSVRPAVRWRRDLVREIGV